MKKLGFLMLLVMPVLIVAMDLGPGKEPSWREEQEQIGERSSQEYHRLREREREAKRREAEEQREAKRAIQEEIEHQLEERRKQEEEKAAAAAYETLRTKMPTALLESIIDPYLSEFEKRWTTQVSQNELRCMSFSPNGAVLAVAGLDGKIYLLNAMTGMKEDTLGGWNNVLLAAFSPDGGQLVTATAYGRLYFWDMATKKVLREYDSHGIGYYDAHGSGHFSVIFSAGGVLALVVDHYGKVVIEDTITKRRLFVQSIGANTAAFNSAATRIVTGSIDGVIRIWDIRWDNILQELTGHKGVVNSVTFSPNDEQIVSTGQDGTVRIWDVTSGKQLHQMIVKSAPIPRKVLNAASAQFSHDGRRIVTGHTHGAVCVWDATTGELLHRMQAAVSSAIKTAAFGPDGERVAAVGENGFVTMWERASLTKFLDIRESGQRPAKEFYEAATAEEKTEAEHKWRGALVGRTEREQLKQQFEKLRSRDNIAELLSKDDMKNLHDIIASLGTKNVTNQDLFDLRDELGLFNEKIEQQNAIIAENKRATAEQERLKVEMKQRFEELMQRPNIDSLLSVVDMKKLTDAVSELSKAREFDKDQMESLEKRLGLLQERIALAQQNKERWLGDLGAIERDYALMLTDNDKKLIAACRATLEQPVSAKRDQRIVAGITRLKKELQKRVSEKVK